ncbi:uncharacterized protein LOC127831783 [Dreissena polymorpha]|uniref:Uncharacterized protein n=1 Tax=Dreissena polymorpha TaxID=45954 RepID=A0A9D4JN46_DREPO|nr:uncharacterized protein LOC127831783 [Dreissena polymorpha]XP_052212815.1 uncharacterized protein LOC127831783 [Dreissena polymorpha]KAH3818301.1 hypothetical protein DPMN_119904 [Dreissena polymorpha]
MTGTLSAAAGSATITLPSAPVVGATLFTVTATADSAIATYEFNTDGNPDTTGAVVKSGTAAVVTLAKAINYPTVKQVIFQVKASDSTAGTAATGIMTVTVNFGPSADSAYSFCVADPTASGTVIGKPTSAVSTASWTLTTGTDSAKFSFADGSIKTAAKLESADKTYYTAELTLTDAGVATTWPLHVLVDNSCVNSGVAQIVSGLVMILMTVLAIHVV